MIESIKSFNHPNGWLGWFELNAKRIGKVTLHNRRPLIGLPAQLEPENNRYSLSRQYTDAILAAGGIPVIIPLMEDANPIGGLVARLDGILLPGSGSDVDPARYGARKEERCGTIQPLRDRTDFFLLELACRRGMPVLAICYGIQSLNVFMGGTLIQDIPSAILSRIKHRNPSRTGHPSHEIEIEAGSVLEELSGTSTVMVNSTHHQAIDRVGSGLKAIARAPDRIIEAVMGPNACPWILGVQWHPEKCYSYDQFSQNIFDMFVAQCRI